MQTPHIETRLLYADVRHVFVGECVCVCARYVQSKYTRVNTIQSVAEHRFIQYSYRANTV